MQLLEEEKSKSTFIVIFKHRIYLSNDFHQFYRIYVFLLLNIFRLNTNLLQTTKMDGNICVIDKMNNLLIIDKLINLDSKKREVREINN